MSYGKRQKRDGTGPHRDSYRRRGEGKRVGRRQAQGKPCPKKERRKS